MPSDKIVDILQQRQDQPGFGAVHDMHQRVRIAGALDALLDPVADAGAGIGMAQRIADRHILDRDPVTQPRHRFARRRRDAQRSLFREEAAMRRMDAAAPHLVRAQQHIVQPVRLVGDGGKRDEFEVRS